MASKLSRADILNKSDLIREDVKVPEWGGMVTLRALTGAERDAYEASMVLTEGGDRRANMHNIRARLVARCLCDDEGNRLFSDDEIELLGAKSGAALARLFEVAKRLSGLSNEDIEDLEKNSEAGRSDGSTSA